MSIPAFEQHHRITSLDAPREHSSPQRSWLISGAILAACSLVLTGLVRVWHVGLVDDTYIFLRYAENIATGHGAVFNVGERVEGYSSPLWTFLLAAAGWFSLNLESIAFVLGILCGIGVIGAAILSTDTRVKQRRWGSHLLVGICLASCPILVFWSGSGMDTVLFTLLVTIALSSAEKDLQRNGLSTRTAILLILATLARMEAILLVSVVLVIFAARRQSVRRVTMYATAIGLALLARYLYYGSWVPNTYYAKVTFGIVHRLQTGLNYFIPAVIANAGVIVLLCTVLPALRTMSPKERVCVALWGGWIAIWCTYVIFVGGDNFALFRFLLPMIPALTIVISRLTVRLLSRYAIGVRRLCILGIMIVVGVSHVRTYRIQAKGYYGDMRLARAWKSVGEWLRSETPPDCVIATIVPGALGYASKRTTIDMLGLTDREVSVAGDVYVGGGHGHSRYHTDYIYQRAPDLVIYHSSGRFNEPHYANPKKIPLRSGYALYDFVTDPRCKLNYRYTTVTLPNGKLLEMLMHDGTTLAHNPARESIVSILR